MIETRPIAYWGEYPHWNEELEYSLALGWFENLFQNGGSRLLRLLSIEKYRICNQKNRMRYS